MGVLGLWAILGELAERRNLNYLSGKRIAIDLSGWVVQALQCRGLNTSKNPHVRNLFFRVSRLLRSGVHPIFVMDGEMPKVKEAAFKEKNHFAFINSEGKVARSAHNRILEQCETLLKTLGVPCIKSKGEAEAYCAFLCSKKLVDGVISEDSDALLYGADPVYREFTIDRNDPHMNEYSLKSKKNKLKLDQTKLIALALLLGCDYVKGVPGIGKDAALKLFSELQDCNILERFKDYRKKEATELFPGYDVKPKRKPTHCNRCAHSGSSTQHKKEGCEMCNSKITCYLSEPKIPCVCEWHKYSAIVLKQKVEMKIYKTVKEKVPDFPNLEVIQEYSSYTDQIPDEDTLEWKCPNLKEFQERVFQFLGWTFSHSHEKFLPIMTSWQQKQLNRGILNTSCFLYKPIKMLKERIVQGEDSVEIQWALIGNDDQSSDLEEETMCTIENEGSFKKSYPKIVESFYSSMQLEKKSTAKLSPIKGKCRKITEFFEEKLDHCNIQENNKTECCATVKRVHMEDNEGNGQFVKKLCS